jgi:hypothetical protein
MCCAGARSWRGAVREDDILVRKDGKRFAFLLPQCDAPDALVLDAGLRAPRPTGSAAHHDAPRRPVEKPADDRASEVVGSAWR